MVRINSVMVPLMLGAMWIVAPYGIVWVATVHLVTAVVFTIIRQLVVNRIVGASGITVVKALIPGFIVATLVLACGLPVRLWTQPGFVSMLLIVLAGAVGGLIGIGLSRSARYELRDVVSKVRG
jgi:hypothetical protein